MQTGGEEPCLECPAVKLDIWLQSTAGRRLSAALELDRLKTTAGVVFRPEDLTCIEAMLLGLVFEERDKYQAELMEKRGSNGTGRR